MPDSQPTTTQPTTTQPTTAQPVTAQPTTVQPVTTQPAAQFEPLPELSVQDASKDEFFVRQALLVDEMLKAHGKDFAMGVLILAARFMAEGKPLIRRSQDVGAPPS